MAADSGGWGLCGGCLFMTLIFDDVSDSYVGLLSYFKRSVREVEV